MEKPNIQSDKDLENQILKDDLNDTRQEWCEDHLKKEKELKTIKEELQTTEKKLQTTEEELRTDHLTGCQNLLALTKWQEKHQSPEKLNDVGIIYVDINDLKSVNDKFGHVAGDKLIVEVAKLLKMVFADDGTVFRKYRGDEFVIGCNNSKNIENYEVYLKSKAQEAQSLASEIYFQFENEITKEKSYISLSFAIGVAVYDGKPHNGENKIDNSLKDTDIRSENDMYVDKNNMKK
jgi:diguanylate cyclase (GGDEF)-like protein